MKYIITMIATVALDLTQAIIIGVLFSSLVFIIKISNLEIIIDDVDKKRLNIDYDSKVDLSNIKVAYITGPLFFATIEKFKEEIMNLENIDTLILSMRGVSLIDTSAIQVLEEIIYALESKGCSVKLCGLQHQVMNNLNKSGIYNKIGEEHIFWSADQAIMKAI